MKSKTKILSIAHIALWCLLVAAGIIQYFTYKPAPGTEPLDSFMTKGVYSIFIVVSIVGIAYALLTHFTLKKIARTANKNLKAVSIISFILFYLCFIFTLLPGGMVLMFVLLWVASLVLQIILLCKKEKEAKPE